MEELIQFLDLHSGSLTVLVAGMSMAETVNIPSLPHGATWRRSSETTAGRRKSPLKSVGVERGRQIHPLS